MLIVACAQITTHFTPSNISKPSWPSFQRQVFLHQCPMHSKSQKAPWPSLNPSRSFGSRLAHQLNQKQLILNVWLKVRQSIGVNFIIIAGYAHVTRANQITDW